MRDSRFRRGLLSAMAGSALALAVMCTSYTAEVRASDDRGEWTCAPPPPGCVLYACFHPWAGGHYCEYVPMQEGANCFTGESCTWTIIE